MRLRKFVFALRFHSLDVIPAPWKRSTTVRWSIGQKILPVKKWSYSERISSCSRVGPIFARKAQNFVESHLGIGRVSERRDLVQHESNMSFTKASTVPLSIFKDVRGVVGVILEIICLRAEDVSCLEISRV